MIWRKIKINFKLLQKILLKLNVSKDKILLLYEVDICFSVTYSLKLQNLIIYIQIK